jgi:hypothetical protein
MFRTKSRKLVYGAASVPRKKVAILLVMNDSGGAFEWSALGSRSNAVS